MNRSPDKDGWVSLSDAQWTNIVNHDHAYESMSKDDAVHLAVKLTEAKCRELNVDAKALTKLRDDFAAQAVAGLTAKLHFPENIAESAYEVADAMIAERAK